MDWDADEGCCVDKQGQYTRLRGHGLRRLGEAAEVSLTGSTPQKKKLTGSVLLTFNSFYKKGQEEDEEACAFLATFVPP